jgi:lipopolysaccharide export system protein LptC
MRLGGGSLFPIVLLGVLTAMTFWLEQATQPEPIGDGKRRHDPDYFVDHFKVRRFDIDGLLQHTLVASHMQHYPDDDTTEVEQPRLIYHRPPTGIITANTGWMDSKGEHVRLNGDVMVVRNSAPGSPPTIIATSTLFVVPDDETARTDAPVSITKGASIVTGSNLEVDNQKQLAVLSGPVRGTIYRNSSSMPETPAIKPHDPIAPAPRASSVRAPAAVVTSPSAPAAAAAAALAAKPAVRSKPAARGKSGQRKTRQSGSRSNHRR